MEDSIIYVIRISLLSLAKRDSPTPTDSPFRRVDSNDHGKLNEQSPIPSPPPRNAWLFQSNPVLYDLRRALLSLREQVWSVSRYSKEICVGDRVFLWEAGRQGGIAGIAEITEPVRVQPEPAEQHPYARVAQAFAGERPRARLTIRSVLEPVIPRQSIVANPELCRMGVLRCSRGTNFRLTVDQWQALNSLIVGDA